MSYQTIILTEQEIAKCRQFCIDSAKTQQKIEFGQHDTLARSNREVARDNMIGKMAEIAIQKLIKKEFDIEIPLDFDIYPRGVWDGNDLTINGWQIDIKSTRKGKWLLVEWNKLDFRQKNHDLPHAFFFCRTKWNEETDEPYNTVELLGTISLLKLQPSNPKVHTLHKGEFIPKTKTKLQADNYGIIYTDLNPDYISTIRYMFEHNPINLNNYPNPYTGECVEQHTEETATIKEIQKSVSKMMVEKETAEVINQNTKVIEIDAEPTQRQKRQGFLSRVMEYIKKSIS